MDLSWQSHPMTATAGGHVMHGACRPNTLSLQAKRAGSQIGIRYPCMVAQGTMQQPSCIQLCPVVVIPGRVVFSCLLPQ